MTRNKLRKILENEVKLDQTFRIIVCKWNMGTIKIILPKEIQKDFNAIRDIDDDIVEQRKESVKYGKLNTSIKKVIDSCCVQLKKHGFQIVSKVYDCIDFTYPKKYQIKNNTLDDSWMDSPQTSNPFWEKMSTNSYSASD